MDNVNHPGHYTQAPVECIDAMRALFGDEALAAHCLLCAFKYLWRAKAKGTELENVRKADWYLRKYIELKSDKVDEAAAPAGAKSATPGVAERMPHVRPIPVGDEAPRQGNESAPKLATPCLAEAVKPEPPGIPEFFYDY